MATPQLTTISSESSADKMNIYLKVIKTVALNVKVSDTIRNLKAVVREKEGVSENFQEVYFGDERLTDECKLIDSGVQNNSTLHLVLQTSGVVKLVVNVASLKKSIEVEAKSHDTIHNIKLMIRARAGISSNDQFTLFYGGRLLENSRTLASLDIKGEATLNLVFDPREVMSLSIKQPTGQIVKTDVKILYKVLDVKELVGSMVDFAVSDYNLAYGGKRLEDSSTLASYSIKEESVLEILPRAFQIFIKLWSGKTITLDVCHKDTISDVKEKISQKLGKPVNFPSCYYLMAAGKHLEDDQDLGRLGVEKHSTLNTVVRLPKSFPTVKLSEIEGTALPRRSTSIGLLKLLIAKKLEKPVKKLFLGRQPLQDHYKLADYSMEKDTVISICFMS